MALINTNVGPERVEVFSQPLGNVPIQGAGISTAAFLISTSLGGAPENQPVRVSTFQDFVDTFGDADDVNFDGYYHVQGWFDNAGEGSEAIIVNVGDSATAADYVGSASDHSGLRALDALDDSMLVMAPGLPLSMAYLVHPALISYSETVRALFGNTLSTSFSLLAPPEEITSPNEDQLVGTAQLTSITGTGPWVLNVESGGTAEVSTVTTVADVSSSLNSTYFLLDTPSTDYYVWMNVGGAGVDPAVALRTGVMIAFAANASANTIASAIQAALDLLSTMAASVLTNVVTVTNAAKGSVPDAQDGTAATGFAFATSIQGVDPDADLSDVTPGMIVKNDAETYLGIISAVDDGADTITVTPDPSTFFDPGEDVNIYTPSAVTYKESVVNNPSKVAAWYFNNCIVLDRSADADPGDLVVVDPTGHCAGVIARIDSQVSIGGPSHAPAGIRFAGIAGIQGLSISISERLHAEDLRLNFINRLQNFPGSGMVIFGGYTADSGTSPAFTADEQLIQVMRTVQFIKASLEPGLRSFLWENQDPVETGRIASSILSFLRNNSYLFPRGLPEPSKFKVISVEPTQDELDIGLVRVRVQIRPNKAIRFIEIALEFPIPV